MPSTLARRHIAWLVVLVAWPCIHAVATPLPISLVPDTPAIVGEQLRLEDALRQDGLWPKLQDGLRALNVPVSDVVSAPHFTPARRHAPHEQSYRTEGGIVLRVDKNTGQIRNFRDEGRLALSGSRQEVINRDTALSIANRALTRLGVGGQLNRGHLSSEASLMGQWRFHLPTGYQGVPCGGGYRIWINDEGRVILYSDGPACVPPPSMEQSISKRRAGTLANAFLRERLGQRGVRTGRSQMEQRVVHPNNAWRDQPREGFVEMKESRLAWVVHYPNLQVDSRPLPATVYIDARSGQALGGVR